jgi:hypothetical protein
VPKLQKVPGSVENYRISPNKVKSLMMFKSRLIKASTLTATLLLSQTITLIPAVAADGDVKLAGQVAFTARAGADGGTVGQRAETIQNNLDNALVASQDRSANAVGITSVRGVPVLTLGGYQVVTVSSADAQAANTTAAAVAQQWADSLRQALSNRASVDQYVSQITGGYPSTAPPSTASADARPSQSYPPRSNNYDSFNSNGAPPNNYQGSANAYGGGSNNSNNYGGGYGGGNYQGAVNSNGYGGGYGGANYGNYPPQGGPPQQGYRQGRVAYAPAGQIIPITLATSIATNVARAGDLIQANITQNVILGDSTIPAGSVVIGQVTEAEAGRRLTRSGDLQIKFNRIRTPDGTETPITAHLSGKINKLKEVGGDQDDRFRGEGMSNKVGSVAFRGLLGTGGGAALGTAVGAIAGGGHGAGMGAWSGAAIGGGLGVADSLLLRKGKDVTIPSGTQMNLQLDAPVSVAGVVPSGGYGGGGY